MTRIWARPIPELPCTCVPWLECTARCHRRENMPTYEFRVAGGASRFRVATSLPLGTRNPQLGTRLGWPGGVEAQRLGVRGERRALQPGERREQVEAADRR